MRSTPKGKEQVRQHCMPRDFQEEYPVGILIIAPDEPTTSGQDAQDRRSQEQNPVP